MRIFETLSRLVYGPVVVPVDVLELRRRLEETCARMERTALESQRAPAAPCPVARIVDGANPTTPEFLELERERVEIEIRFSKRKPVDVWALESL